MSCQQNLLYLDNGTPAAGVDTIGGSTPGSLSWQQERTNGEETSLGDPKDGRWSARGPSKQSKNFYKQQEVKNYLKESLYKSYDELPLFLNADTVAKALGVSPSSGYELLHEPGFPSLRVGNRIVVPKEMFMQWVEQNTGRCK